MVRQVDIKALVSHIVRGDGADKCRICMGDTTEGQVYLGDTVMVDEDKPVTLSELLQTITGVEVQPEDHLPAGLCSTCTTALLDACHFRKLCLQAATQWNTTLRLLNKLDMKGNVKATFAVIDDGQISLLYDFCGGPVTGKSALKRLSTLAGEKEFNHKQNKVVTHSSQCLDCGKKFQKVQSLYHHLKESSDLKRACQYCAQIMHRDDLVVHLKEIHDKEPYPCERCPAILKNKKQYNSHLDKVHSVGVVYCGECGRSFRSSYALRAHVSIHAPKKCPACDRLFRNQTCYLYHVKQCCDLNVNRQDAHRTKTKVTVQVANQFGDKKVKVGLRGSANSECVCDYCGKKFAGKKFVCAHIQTVHMKNTHKPCVYCGKILPSAYMTVHLKKHRPRDTFTCEFCGFSLKSKLGYTQHIRIHTGEKPYPCKYCNESFLGSSRRSEHIRNKHNKSNIVLKYACNKCPARFRLPYHLKKHIASKHIERKLGHHSHRLNEEPMRPRGVCVSCATAAIAAQELRLLVMQSQTYWTDVTKSLTEIPLKAPAHVKSLFGFIDPDSLSLHIIENYKPMEPDNALVILSNHSKRKPQASERRQRVPRGNGPSCTCEDCNKVFPSPFYLDIHLKNSGHKEACLICGVMMVRGGPMKDHMYSEHGEKFIMCNECPLLFNNESEMKFHKKNSHKPGDLTCNQCGRTFKRLTTFENHFQMHTVNICRSCGVQFTNRGCYREHRSKCEPNAKPDIQTVPRSKRSNIRDPATFTCDHCGKTYLSRSQLKNHILWIHMDVRPHQCSSCGKRFYTMSRLLEHTVVHTRVRNFECDICGVKLVSKMAAVYHRRRHTGEKPYKCEDCGETFISSSRRSEHSKRRHDKGDKIKCTQCPARFVRNHELKKHMVKVHSSGKQDVDSVPGRKKLKSNQT